MADRLTQLQDAVDQLAHQFVACIYYVNKHHSLIPVNPTDVVRDVKSDADQVEPYPPATFLAGQRELAQDLIIKEQQIEYLISKLPGLTHSEKDQEERIRVLEQELKEAEEERKSAVTEREQLLGMVEEVIRSARRP